VCDPGVCDEPALRDALREAGAALHVD
jgi:hypothetical protein